MITDLNRSAGAEKQAQNAAGRARPLPRGGQAVNALQNLAIPVFNGFMNQNHCRYCKNKVPAWRHKQAMYCSATCRQEFYKTLQPSRKAPFNRANTGPISEILVCADLLKRGFSVFRAISPAASCDLVYLDNGKLIRVEVKTAYRTGNGKSVFGMREHQKTCHDLLALVFHSDNSIEYRPPFPTA